MKHDDPFFYNSRTGQWNFFGTSEDELTGLQAAYILSMSDQEIAQHVKDDILVLPGRPLYNVDDKQSYKKMFVINGYSFFANVVTGAVRRARGKDLEKFVYTD